MPTLIPWWEAIDHAELDEEEFEEAAAIGLSLDYPSANENHWSSP